MALLGCLMHWYISMMYVVPVLAVGGWGWWSSRRISRRRKGGGPPSGPTPPAAPKGAPARATQRTPTGVGV
jgi:hypothetical protein